MASKDAHLVELTRAMEKDRLQLQRHVKAETQLKEQLDNAQQNQAHERAKLANVIQDLQKKIDDLLHEKDADKAGQASLMRQLRTEKLMMEERLHDMESQHSHVRREMALFNRQSHQIVQQLPPPMYVERNQSGGGDAAAVALGAVAGAALATGACTVQ